MLSTSTNTLVNPLNGNLAFKIFYFEGKGHFDYVQRNNYYTIVITQKCNGILKADFTGYEIEGKNVFAFSPYQPFLFDCPAVFEGISIHFHPDFFCIYKHQDQVACNGVLFNNIYKPPFVALTEEQEEVSLSIIKQMDKEIQQVIIGQYELLVAYLKILLIHLSRIKIEKNPQALLDNADYEQPFVLQNLKDAIEANYKTKHRASDYADILHISSKALGKLTKKHFNKTLTELISERIVIEAKRELYQTSKTVKEIAYELGYDDEFYFSRFFKKNTDVSPQIYRETVGFAAME